MAAEWIGYKQRALRIIAPLTVHKKTVIIRATPKPDRRPPDAVRTFAQSDRLILPISEATDELYVDRGRCEIGKILNFDVFRQI